MPKPKRATWWKMFSHQRAVIESVSNEDAGMGLKAAFRYFDGEPVQPDDLSQAAFTIFCVMRPYIDESMQDYVIQLTHAAFHVPGVPHKGCCRKQEYAVLSVVQQQHWSLKPVPTR